MYIIGGTLREDTRTRRLERVFRVCAREKRGMGTVNKDMKVDHLKKNRTNKALVILKR